MEVSPGAKSTEFKALILAFVMAVVDSTPWVSIEPTTLNLLIMSCLAYGGFRTGVKMVAHKNTENSNA